MDTVKVGALLPLLAEVVVDLEVMQVLVPVPVLEVPQGLQGRRGGGRGCAMDKVKVGALLPLLAEVVVDLEVMPVLVLVPVLEVPQGIQGRRGGGGGCAMDTVETTRSTVTTVRGGEQEESRRMRS